jgi:uncharacterized protein
MQIHRSEIPQKGLDLDYEADPATLDLKGSGAEFLGTVQVRARLDSTDHSVYVLGEVQALAKLQCVRCLEGLSYPVHSSFEMTVVPEESKTGGLPGEWHELDEKELEEYLYSGDIIDLTDVVREHLFLSLPTYPLCRPDCRGLCPQCGADLNRMSCRCVAEDVRPPMTGFQEKLKKIIKK